MALELLQQHAEVVARVGEAGVGFDDFLKVGQRLLVASELAEHVGDVVVRGGGARVEPGCFEKHRQGVVRPALVDQGDAQGVVRVDQVRVRGDLAPQQLFRRLEVAEGEMAVAEAVASAPARGCSNHLAQRRHCLLEPVLEQQARSEEIQRFDFAGMVPQRGARDTLCRAQIVALDRLPALG